MEPEEFMQEYMKRLAFSLAQFWPAEEELPDDESKADEAFFSGAIRRLGVFRRAELAKILWLLIEDGSGFFTRETDRLQRVGVIRGVIQRFPLLAEANHDYTFNRDNI